jgi:methylated-DNA-[protein]-cysteine S-methyltransferase
MSAAAPYVFAVVPPGPTEAAHAVKTRAGYAGLLVRGDVLCRVVLPTEKRSTLEEGFARSGVVPKTTPPARELRSVVDVLTAYFEGAKVDPAAAPVLFDPGPITPFTASVYAALRGVVRGRTASYGELARRAGSVGAARAVGCAMSANRFPLFVPCHRVLSSGGRIGGFSSERGLADKVRLLALEGIPAPRGSERIADRGE